MRAKSIGCKLHSNSGLPSITICSHLIIPKTLLLKMMTFTGSLYFTAVASSPISMVKPPYQHGEAAVSNDGDHLAIRMSDLSSDGVRAIRNPWLQACRIPNASDRTGPGRAVPTTW
jgi:hypothetical protein